MEEAIGTDKLEIAKLYLSTIHIQYNRVVNSINNMYIKAGIVIAFIGAYTGIILTKVCNLKAILNLKTTTESVAVAVSVIGLLASISLSVVSVLKLIEVLKSYEITTLDEESLSIKNTLENDEYIATIGLVNKYQIYLKEIENVSDSKISYLTVD